MEDILAACFSLAFSLCFLAGGDTNVVDIIFRDISSSRSCALKVDVKT